MSEYQGAYSSTRSMVCTGKEKWQTALTTGRQFTIYQKDHILNECIKANYVDCRINAYPVLDDSTIPIQAPNFIFIDLDLSKDMPYEEALIQLEKSKNKILKTIEEKWDDCIPIVLWTGNGYHIYIILETRPFEMIKELKELSPKPSEEFLKFAKIMFSNRKKDSSHNPTFRSSLLRIPYTFNSKNLNVDKEKAGVKIIQEFVKDNVPSINTEILRAYPEIIFIKMMIILKV